MHSNPTINVITYRSKRATLRTAMIQCDSESTVNTLLGASILALRILLESFLSQCSGGIQNNALSKSRYFSP